MTPKLAGYAPLNVHKLFFSLLEENIIWPAVTNKYKMHEININM